MFNFRNAFVCLLLCVLTKYSVQFRPTTIPSRKTVTETRMLSTVSSEIVIRAASGDELPRCADFLSKSMYGEDTSKAQQKELSRLELQDISKRYGALVGKRKFPTLFLVATEDEEIVGTVGVDCQFFENGRFRQIATFRSEVDGDRPVVPLLANLAVRRDKRKKGIAKQLIDAAESRMKEEKWGFDDIYLLVDSQNAAAQRLYTKKGYKLLFEDPDATCIVAGQYSLQTRPCLNFCFKKRLVAGKASSGGGGSSAVGGFLGNLFGGLLGGGKSKL